MKSQSEIYTIKQQIEHYKSQIKQCQYDIDSFEERKRSSSGSADTYDREISLNVVR